MPIGWSCQTGGGGVFNDSAKNFAVSVFIVLGLLLSGCGSASTGLIVNSISPTGGSTLGATEVTINGRNFDSDTTVTFDGRSAARVGKLTSTQFFVSTPQSNGETGQVDVVVTDSTGDSVTLTNGYRYTSMLVSSNRLSNDIATFSVTSGTPPTITAFTGSPFGAGGVAPKVLGVDEQNKLIFAPNGNSTIAVFDYSMVDGALTQVSGSPFAAEASLPISVAVDTVEHLIFVANSGSSDFSSFSYDTTTGALTVVEEVVAGDTEPYDVVIDMGRRLAFVANRSSGTISAFTYDADGSNITAVAAPKAVGGNNPTALAIDTTNRLLFTSNFGSSTMSAFTYSATGVLTQVGSAKASDGTGPFDIILDTTNKFLFVANRTDSTVASFEYTSAGVLTKATGFAISSGGTQPDALALDVAKKTLFVGNSGSSDISIITYDEEGYLADPTSITASGGSAPYSLLFIP